jgi:collagenase-like PrtC family protease
MKLALAANYDFSLVPKLAGLPVGEVYGKFPSDFAGGGRPSYMGTPLGRKDLRQYVELLRRHGIDFNYLLNSACMGNREWTARFQRKLMRLLETLGEMGVTWLTVSTPYLLEAIKARFPNFRIKVGLYALVDTPRRAKFWEDLGADSINLECRTINRNFPLLAAIRSAVRCDLQLIANHVCLPNCPVLAYHQNGIAHSSDGSGTLFIDDCFLRCSRMRLEDPSLFIKAGWIRPEDVARYEAMGYESFKILERGIPSEELLKRAEAYNRRRFEGNLAELLLPYGFRRPVRKSRLWGLRHFFKPRQIKLSWIRPFFDLMKGQGMLFPLDRQPIHIDSAAIGPDFLEGFATRDCTRLDCRQCGYCERLAEKAVRVDPAFRQEYLGRYQHIRQAMIDGRPWGV